MARFGLRVHTRSAIRMGAAALVCLMLAELVGCADEIDDASQRGDVGKVRAMLDAHPQLLNSRGHHEATPLHLAALSGQHSVVELLLTKGAQVDARDGSGWTPLVCAAVQGHRDIVELLLSYHADVNARDNTNRTALYWAEANTHEDVVTLLKAGGGTE